MKRALIIHTVSGTGSIGRICAGAVEELTKQGYECVIAYGRGEPDPKTASCSVKIGCPLNNILDGIGVRLLDRAGLGSKLATRRFLAWAEEFDPDLVWLHNLHGYYINVEELFAWIKGRPAMQVRWTLHDCWPMTGHCVFYSAAHCRRFETGCHDCPNRRRYPASYLLDGSRRHYERKKAAFTGVVNMTLVTPSRWLAEEVCRSFLKEYPVEVVPNRIDTGVFCPRKSDFRRQHALENKQVILGVANGWGQRKGLEDMLRLDGLLDHDRQAMVLVGVSEKVKPQIPDTVLALGKTQNVRELAEIYTAADVLVNPTHEDNYPTVNLEARACGTPVVTYNVGGSPESAGPEHIVAENDIAALAREIEAIGRKNQRTEEIE